MSLTPFIRTIKEEGGTFYTFSSASKDITTTFNNANKQFAFSKFALLNLPNIKTPTNNNNDIQFNTIDGAIFNNNFSNLNISLIESFQNYALNLENLLLCQEDYDNDLLQTTSEKVFFKWLKELGAIRFQESSTNDNISNEFRAIEEDSVNVGTNQYEKVVQYIGEIDVVNNVVKGGRSYSEVFLYVPNTHGNTPTILFGSKSDNNYQEGTTLQGTNEFIEGRENTNIHPQNLSIEAFYDYDNPITYNNSTNANWHNSTSPNSYFLESSFEDTSNINIVKDSSDYSLPFSPISYKRSRLDGIGIDFEASSYQNVFLNSSISNLSQTNTLPQSTNFDYNVVLLYYDVWDTNNSNNRATNLFGVLFLDNVESDGANGGFIPRYKKYKQDAISKLNGNSFGLTLNFNFDVSIEETSIDTIINDYNTFSLELFSESLIKLKDIASNLQDNSSEIDILNSRLNQLETMFFNIDNVKMLETRINSLENSFNNANLLIDNHQAIFDLIEMNSNRINTILEGNTPLDLRYSFENFINGSGILLSRVNNSLVITNQKQDFNSLSEFSLDLSINNTNVVSLGQFSNYFRDISSGGIALDTIVINVDDRNVKWSNGQRVRFTFPNEIKLQGFNLVFKGDANNNLGNGEFGVTLGVVSSNDFINSNGKPIIELICNNENEYLFYLDIVK